MIKRSRVALEMDINQAPPYGGASRLEGFAGDGPRYTVGGPADLVDNICYSVQSRILLGLRFLSSSLRRPYSPQIPTNGARPIHSIEGIRMMELATGWRLACYDISHAPWKSVHAVSLGAPSVAVLESSGVFP